MSRALPRLAASALSLLALPLLAAPLKESWSVTDHGRRAEFVIARDELHRQLRPQRVAAKASVEEIRRAADAEAGDLVIYEKGLPHTEASRRLVTKQLSVRLAPGTDAASVAAAAGLVNTGAAAGAPGWLIFRSNGGAGSALVAAEKLRAIPGVAAAQPLLARQQVRRAYPGGSYFQDQWNLHNSGVAHGSKAGIDLDPGPSGQSVWDTYRGSGVTIGIVDDGLQRTHPDLAGNYDPALSYDFDYNDTDPLPPPYDGDDHGTACAGLAAATGLSGAGTYGVAYEAHLAGLRLISTPETDAQEAAAFSFRNDAIGVKSNSWGPDDSGFIVEGPGPLAIAALEDAVKNGRGGLGTIFVWAGGNGALNGDSSSFDGYTSRREVIAVGAVTNGGVRAPYAEPGANLLCVAPSDGGTLSIPSVDRPGDDGYNYPGAPGDYPNEDYTKFFGGTSAASPQVAGCVALMLQARPALGWRDVKGILLNTAVNVLPTDAGWLANGAGHHFNLQFGAGLVDLHAAVNLAATWQILPPEISVAQEDTVPALIPDNKATGATKQFVFSSTDLKVEQVALTVETQHALRGQLEVYLTSPMGTKVKMAPTRRLDHRANFESPTFTSPFFWDEVADGTWTVTVADRVAGTVGTLKHVKLELFGSAASGRGTPAGYAVTADGNGNGAIDPGETTTVRFTVGNDGTAPLTGATATLLPLSGLSAISGPVSIGTVAPGATADASFTFSNSAMLGQTIYPTLQITTSDSVTSNVIFPVVIGTVETATFTSTGAISIPRYPATSGVAAPYGSPVTVSGLPANAVVTKVALHLDHLSHRNSADIDMLLVSPQHGKMIPMSDVGDYTADDIDLVLDDEAEAPMPDLGALYGGRFRPTNYGATLDLFPAPAPPGPYASRFATFAGQNPAGDWLLFIRDDTLHNVGGLGSWSLDITYAR